MLSQNSSFSMERASQIPSLLREKHLDALELAQEFYLESRVQAGTCWTLKFAEAPMGYVVLDQLCVVEFFIDAPARTEAVAIFADVISRTSATSALCQSFDSLLKQASENLPHTRDIVANLFREIQDPSFHGDPGVSSALARVEDLDAILEIHDGFFESREEIASYMVEDGLFLYRRGGHLVGCGIMKRIIPGRTDFDIGMVVARAARRQGLGAYIVSHLKSQCLQRGFRPVAGCEARHNASRRALENAGLASSHVMYRYRFVPETNSKSIGQDSRRSP